MGEERGRIDDLIGIDVDFRFPVCQRGFFIHGLHLHNSQQPARTVHLRFPLPDIRKGRCMNGCMYGWMGNEQLYRLLGGWLFWHTRHGFLAKCVGLCFGRYRIVRIVYFFCLCLGGWMDS